MLDIDKENGYLSDEYGKNIGDNQVIFVGLHCDMWRVMITSYTIGNKKIKIDLGWYIVRIEKDCWEFRIGAWKPFNQTKLKGRFWATWYV